MAVCDQLRRAIPPSTKGATGFVPSSVVTFQRAYLRRPVAVFLSHVFAAGTVAKVTKVTDPSSLSCCIAGSSVTTMLGGVRALSRPDTAEAVTAFLADHPVPQGEQMIAQHLERLRVNVALRTRAATELADAAG